MAALAERRIIPHEELKARAEEKSDAEAASRPRRVRSTCGCWRRCCSPLPCRSTRRRSAARLPEDVDLKASLQVLQAEYSTRGVNLVKIANKWAFRTAGDLSWLLTKEAIVPKKLSRAAIETLAIIAYHQPVTRAEVEEIRGVVMSKGTLDVLMEIGWIRPRGRRKVPGRPITYGTTEDFLSHFGLEHLGDLPGLDELKGSGLSTTACRPASTCRCRPTIRRCAMTRTRWSRATSTSVSRRRPSASRSRAPHASAVCPRPNITLCRLGSAYRFRLSLRSAGMTLRIAPCHLTP